MKDLGIIDYSRDFIKILNTKFGNFNSSFIFLN